MEWFVTDEALAEAPARIHDLFLVMPLPGFVEYSRGVRPPKIIRDHLRQTYSVETLDDLPPEILETLPWQPRSRG